MRSLGGSWAIGLVSLQKAIRTGTGTERRPCVGEGMWSVSHSDMSDGTVARQAPLSLGFSRQEYRSGLPCPSPGDLPNPGTETLSLMSPALAGAGGFFTTSATWEAHDKHISVHKWIYCGYYFEQIAVRSIKKNERFCSIFTYSFFDALL